MSGTPAGRTQGSPTTAQLFVTCLVDAFYPEVGFSVVEILERLGVRVHVPDGQTCCGQPAFNAGFWEDARAMARHTLDVLDAADGPIVIPSGSCADMIVHQYAELFGSAGGGAVDEVYRAKAARVAARTFELTQFLTDVLGKEDVGAASTGSVAYHACCHGLRGLGVLRQPQCLLANVEGLEQRPLAEADTCCGFGGLFAVKMADISGAMLGRKLDAIEASGADTVAVTDVSCLMHMAGGLHRRGSAVRVRHIAEVLRKPVDQKKS
jgi:L-lactate dehydrogenase complex protein LldE